MEEKAIMKEVSNEWKNKSDEFWKNNLSKEQYRVCRESGTEKPFSGIYNKFKKDGVFKCKCCGQELFVSDKKYDSGSGWPSFYEALEGKVTLHDDSRLMMKRVEAKCSRCGAHLGHLFDDGPEPTGKRYCVNSVSLDFEEKAKK